MTSLTLQDEAAQLRQSAAITGLTLNEDESTALLRYLDMLERWNSVYNLTAVRGRDAMRTQHLLDCLAIIEPFRRMTEALRRTPPKRILDVGSGAGLPGVILATLLPDWTVVCVDAVGKKSAFVRQVATELALRNLQPVHTRVEALDVPAFGVICTRAFSSLSRLVELTHRQLAQFGLYLAMKGKTPHDELREMRRLQPAVDVFQVEQLTVPDLHAERCLVWMRTSGDEPLS